MPLADCEVGAKVTILRFENEAEDLLHYLKTAGIEPGLQGTIAANDGEEVEVQVDADTSSVTFSVAETVSVLADPSPPPRTALPETARPRRALRTLTRKPEPLKRSDRSGG